MRCTQLLVTRLRIIMEIVYEFDFTLLVDFGVNERVFVFVQHAVNINALN